MTLKKTIEEARAKVQLAERELWRLMGKCKHSFKPLTQNQLKDKWMSESAFCDTCGVHFGWRCKKSPDSVCHYHTEGGAVDLIEGTPDFFKYRKTGNWTSEDNESDDCCVYCGHPDERK